MELDFNSISPPTNSPPITHTNNKSNAGHERVQTAARRIWESIKEYRWPILYLSAAVVTVMTLPLIESLPLVVFSAGWGLHQVYKIQKRKRDCLASEKMINVCENARKHFQDQNFPGRIDQYETKQELEKIYQDIEKQLNQIYKNINALNLKTSNKSQSPPDEETFLGSHNVRLAKENIDRWIAHKPNQTTKKYLNQTTKRYLKSWVTAIDEALERNIACHRNLLVIHQKGPSNNH